MYFSYQTRISAQKIVDLILKVIFYKTYIKRVFQKVKSIKSGRYACYNCEHRVTEISQSQLVNNKKTVTCNTKLHVTLQNIKLFKFLVGK